MARGVRALAGVLLLSAALAAAIPAHAQSLTLSAAHPEKGWIKLTVGGPDGTVVDLAEQTPTGPQPVAEVTVRNGSATVRHAEIWRCDRYVRTFVASAALPDGSTQTATTAVRTPSCKHRLALAVRAMKHRRARRVRITVTDTFGVGDVPARVCVAAPGRNEKCHSLHIPGGRKSAILSYRATGPGLWSVALQTDWKQFAAARVYIRPARTLRLLATGDSMIEFVDTALGRQLAKHGIKVKSDSRISTGISKPFLLNWPNLAKRQARSVKPDVTVIFLGANDGFPFGGVNCCGQDWIDAYATRVQSMMSSYSRQGHGLVYWLTLPAPQPAQWKPIYPAVNRAIKQAASGFAGQVHVVDIAKVISPGYRFTPTIVRNGHRITVRQGDGVHLSEAGAQVAAGLVEAALRADGAV